MAVKDQKITKVNDEIHIFRPLWGKLAITTYREDYFEELCSLTWTKSGEYLRSSKLEMQLHRYIMAKWYGDTVLEEMTKNGFIVDHINNDGFDCRISNLEFLSSDENKAKGFTLDKQTQQMKNHVALSIFKDFSTNKYQITLGFNDFYAEYNDGMLFPVVALKLLYDCDYRIVINDAREILLLANQKKIINPNKLNFIDKRVIYSQKVDLTPEEQNGCIIQRDGKYLLILNEHTRLDSIHYDAGWE